MNAFFKIAVWAMVYVILGFTLADGIALLIRAVKAGIVKAYPSRRAIVALTGAVISAGCAVFAFYSFTVHGKAAIIEGYENFIQFFSEEMYGGFADIDDMGIGISEIMYILSWDNEYIAALYSSAGALSVVLGVYLLFSCFGGLYYITGRGLLRKGMLTPEEITAKQLDGKINIYLKSDEIRTKPFKVFKANEKNSAALERFIEKEDRQDLFVVGG
ncbi:MAG: hypothetical protein K2G32_00450 [Oscillospiraceae bacterium]|nr:hypothetical protein [Oscillospiraceae bacterium]